MKKFISITLVFSLLSQPWLSHAQSLDDSDFSLRSIFDGTGTLGINPSPILLAQAQIPQVTQAPRLPELPRLVSPRQPYDPSSNYSRQLQWIRQQTVDSAEKFIGNDYQEGGSSLHGIDCSGLIHRILFNGFQPARNTAHGYFQKAQENNFITTNPQKGDVFFVDWGRLNNSDSRIDHTGIVEGCYGGRLGYTCRLIHASGGNERGKVRRSEIVQQADGKWRYYHLGTVERTYPTLETIPQYNHQPAINLNFQFADSLKMRGLPSVEEVSRGQTIGRTGQAAQDKLGGVDLTAPFPLDSQALGLGPLEAIRLSPDGQSLTLYATPSQPGVELHGVNPSDVLTVLQSYARTGRAPSFTLLPDQQSSQQIQQALESVSAALNNRGPLSLHQTGKLLYGRQVWNYLGISNPSSFSMNAIFSDSGLQNTHAGEVLLASANANPN